MSVLLIFIKMAEEVWVGLQFDNTEGSSFLHMEIKMDKYIPFRVFSV